MRKFSRGNPFYHGKLNNSNQINSQRFFFSLLLLVKNRKKIYFMLLQQCNFLFRFVSLTHTETKKETVPSRHIECMLHICSTQHNIVYVLSVNISETLLISCLVIRLCCFIWCVYGTQHSKYLF